MNHRRVASAAAVMAVTIALTGCGTGDAPLNSAGTWQDAKAAAQETELELAKLIASDNIVSVEQNPEGVLLSCDQERYQWTGRTKVILADGADPTEITLAIGNHFDGGTRFKVTEHTISEAKRMVQLIAHDNEENYIIRPNNDGGLDISSASTCFTLPDGTYPRGKF